MTPTIEAPTPMTDLQILALFLRRTLLVVLVTLVGVVGVGAVELKLGKNGLEPRGGRYRSRAQVLVDLPRLGAAEQNQAALPNILRSLGEKDVLETASIAEEVSKRIGGAYTPAEVHDLTSFRNANGTSVMNIDARADSPADAVSLAQAVVDVYRDRYDGGQKAAQTPLQNRYETTVISTPTLGGVVDEGLRATQRIVAGASIAATVGLLLAFALPVDEIATGRRRRPVSELVAGFRRMWPARPAAS